MPNTLLGVRLDQPVVFGLFIDGQLDELQQILFASPLPQRGLDVDFLIREETASQMALGGET